MRVAVIGGTGCGGRAVVGELCARGHAVLVLHRGETGPPPAGVAEARCDRADADALGRALADFAPTAVVDHVAYTAAEVDAAVDALPASTSRYLLVSSAMVYGLAADRPYREDDSPRAIGAAAADKLAAEARARERAPGALCLRLGGLYGPGHAPMTPVGRDARLLGRLSRGEAVPVPRGAGPLQPWFSGDHGRVVAALLAHASPPSVLNAAGPEILAWPAQMAAWAALVDAPAPRCEAVSPEWLRARAPVWMQPFLDTLWRPPVLDTTRLAALFGGHPPATPFADGVRRAWEADSLERP